MVGCKFAWPLVLLGVAAMGAAGQQPAPAAGLENPWDVRTILDNIGKDLAELEPVVNGLTPQQWVDKKGAPSSYILQWQTAQRQFNDLRVTNRAFAQKTDSLAAALDDYFRLEALDVTLRNLEDGTLHYGERAAADKLARLTARGFADRERLRTYIRDLAESLEQHFQIADAEAQRCRGMISKEPPARKTHR